MVWRKRKTDYKVTANARITTGSTTSTTTIPAPTPTARYGQRMGISAGATASLRVLDECVALGVTWVRVSHELGWTNTLVALQTTVNEAHKRGLKVLQCIQKAGHAYTATDGDTLYRFAQQCVTTGIDALELGNEWNNPAFFTPDEHPPHLAPILTSYVGGLLRQTYPLLPIITNGMSPRPLDQTPHLWWPTFWDNNPAGHYAAGYTAQAIHPYVYPEDPCGLIGHPEWNPWWALPIIRDAMTARNVHQPVWFTEVGCPGDPTGQTVIRNIVCDEQRQAFVTSQYLKQWRTLGHPDEPIFIATAFDGDSVSVPGPENYLGLCRKDGTRKPAWQIVHDTAALPA
jgi:hypothetical protein